MLKNMLWGVAVIRIVRFVPLPFLGLRIPYALDFYTLVETAIFKTDSYLAFFAK